ncbi:hypothetical protein PGT21_008349 [Puccinia graminis f. sp. tritici]|uniref:Uncharacterized protein n=1 Tax=Puccinia graminis f. sp. tritici TaxID=56615 RepID=A0A5B0P434_PUCGR|nr:hypothetical protein PGT21_008349 [Puccinia graminis f. sp. tritici]KAA1099085.1 hypothetical protein PGTUg99_015480 [Puccinia graminis f. sp. tritici]
MGIGADLQPWELELSEPSTPESEMVIQFSARYGKSRRKDTDQVRSEPAQPDPETCDKLFIVSHASLPITSDEPPPDTTLGYYSTIERYDLYGFENSTQARYSCPKRDY